MGQHYKNVCQYGHTHGQCRCPGPKQVKKIDCTTPAKHKPKAPEGDHERVVEEAKAIIEGWNLSASAMGEVGGWMVATAFGKAIFEGIEG